MTTIVWHMHHGLFADRLVTGHHAIAMTKLEPLLDGSIIAVAGSTSLQLAIVEWLDGGEKPTLHKDDGVGYLRAYPDGRVTYSSDLRPELRVDETGLFYAIGSGSDYAMGAMAAGAGPKVAIEIAGQFDPCTGRGIDMGEVIGPGQSRVRNIA